MMKIFVLLFILFLFSGCQNDVASVNPMALYFYPLNQDPVVYVYRDATKGIDERYHRIYRIEDSFGKHLVVEIYSSEARLLEAYNYNIDSLDLMDHMVVDGNRNNQKCEIGKAQLMPFSKKEKGEFLSRIPGPTDSTYIMYAIDREVMPKQKKMQKVFDQKEESVVFSDDFTFTLFNDNDEAIDQKRGKTISYYSKGFGLTRWHDEEKELDFRLEKMMSETEWAKLVLN